MKSVSRMLAASLFLLVPFVASAQASTSAPAAPSATVVCTDLHNDMFPGSQDGASGEVTKLQQYLKDSGYLKVDPNGYFGPRTAAAVAAFQTANAIAPLGIAGLSTRAKIKSLSCGASDSDAVYGGGSVLFALAPTCAASFYEAEPGQPVTWTLDFSGGSEPYSYSWSDSVGSSAHGSSATADASVSISKTYQGQGKVGATLTAKSADGETATADCGSVDVGSNAGVALSSGPSFDSPAPSDAHSPWYESFFNPGSWFGTNFFDGYFSPDQPLDNSPLDSGMPPDSSCTLQNGCLSVTDPFITGLSLSEARIGDTIVIYGTSFTGHNAIVVNDTMQFPSEVASPDGSTLTVTIPHYLGALCAFKVGVACSQLAQQFSPGDYDISVVTQGADGTARESTRIPLTIVQ